LGVGRVAIESLALGIPVIPVNSAYWAPVVSRDNYEALKADNFVGRPFYEFEPEPLLAELLCVLGDLDKVCHETQNLSEEVYQDFSLTRMVDLIEEVYQELVD
jgi:glycosyltransferase involved in cell wall biosynthesis